MWSYIRALRLRAAALPLGITLALAGCSAEQLEPTERSLFRLDAPSVTTHDEFDVPLLGAGWTPWDGYAEAEPNDTSNHASFELGGSHLSISIPDGVEHNMWWQRHAQVTRDFEGSGVYQTKMDAGLGDQQFGLVFESEPGTFLIFMLYGHDALWGYAERFVTVNGEVHKHTFPGSGSSGHNTGFSVPDAGPYQLRVTLRDAVDPGARYWRFDWSRDGASWVTATEGILESSDEIENIGAIQKVGVFAGNQPPSPFIGFDAMFDHYKVYPVELSGSPGDAQVQLDWLPVAGAQGYRVYQSAIDGGPYSLVGTVSQPGFVDQGLTNDVPYYYVVTSYDSGPAVGYSVQVKVVPHAVPAPPEDFPVVEGLALMLDASSLAGLSDNDPVEQWLDLSGNGHVAMASGSIAPTFAETGLGGQPAVVFDGVDDFLTLSGGFEDFTEGVTILAVVRPTSLQSGFKLVLLGNGPGSHNIGLGRAGTSSGLQYFTTNSAGSYGWFDTPSGLVAGAAAVLGVSQPGGISDSMVSAVATVNGTEVGGGDAYVPPVVQRVTNYVGKSYWQEGMLEGSLAELVVFDRELSVGERGALQAYFDNKYALSAQLSPPESVAAVAENGEIVLNYGAVNGATEYVVYRAGAAAGPFAEIATISETSYVDADVTAGTYFYQVTASDGEIESAPSTVVSATIEDEPPANLPTGVPGSGLLLFLNASTLGLADGATVSSWIDGSGRGNDAVALAGPVYAEGGLNGYPAVVFDGVDDHLTLPNGFDDFTGGVSLFVVAEPTELHSGFKVVALGNGAGVDNLGFGRAGTSAGLQWYTNNSSNEYGWFNTAGGLVSGEPAVFGVHQPGGSVNAMVTTEVTVDGASVGSGSAYVPPIKARAVNYIGKSFWSEGYFEGRIAEVLLYKRQLSVSERASVQAYLDTKYELSVPEPPSAPPSLQASAVGGTIALSYGAVAEATEYVIYRATAASGPFAEVGSTSATSYVDAAVTPGTTYYYVVTASAGELESDPSAAASASVPVLPAALPSQGLALFLDASALNLSNGAQVSSWVDASGQGHDAIGVSGPTFAATGFNGHPAVEFDGVDDHLTLNEGFEDFSAGLSLFIVAEPTVLQSGFKLLALGNGGGLDNLGFGRAGGSSGLQYFTNNSGNSVGWFNTESGLSAGAGTVFGVHQPGGTVNAMVTAVVTVQGASVGSGSVYVPPVKGRAVNYIGKSYWSEGYFQGRIAEVVLYSRQLSASEQSAVHAYLDDKYDL